MKKDGTGVEGTHKVDFCIVGGGYPLLDEQGDVIGGIGVSGGTVEEDKECCLAGMRKVGFKTEFEDPFTGVSVKAEEK